MAKTSKKKTSKKAAKKKAVKKKAVKVAKARPAAKKAKKVKKAAKKAPARKAAKKAAPARKKAVKKKKKQIVGEGDYAATRAFDKDQAGFVTKNKARIPAMGKAAEQALDGPEGDSLRAAEATAAARSRDNF